MLMPQCQCSKKVTEQTPNQCQTQWSTSTGVDVTYTAIVSVGKGETFQADRKLHITTANDILNFKFGELGRETKFLDNTGIFTSLLINIEKQRRRLNLRPIYSNLQISHQ